MLRFPLLGSQREIQPVVHEVSSWLSGFSCTERMPCLSADGYISHGWWWLIISDNKTEVLQMGVHVFSPVRNHTATDALVYVYLGSARSSTCHANWLEDKSNKITNLTSPPFLCFLLPCAYWRGAGHYQDTWHTCGPQSSLSDFDTLRGKSKSVKIPARKPIGKHGTPAMEGFVDGRKLYEAFMLLPSQKNMPE